MYGTANMGVSDTMLDEQRSGVALASVAGGSSNVDMALAIADGSGRGKADPAFPAHEQPIGIVAKPTHVRTLESPPTAL